MSRKLEYLVIHCTATPEGREVTPEDIKKWHTSSKSKGGRGWSRVGYTDLIQLDGSLKNLMPYDQDDEVDPWEITNGARGFNSKSRHIVYSGGCQKTKPKWSKHYPPKDTRTEPQKEALLIYVLFTIMRHPNIKVIGHNEIANKACPSFNVGKWLREIGVEEKNIGV